MQLGGMGVISKNKGWKTQNRKRLLAAPSKKIAKRCNNLICLSWNNINKSQPKIKTSISYKLAPGNNLWHGKSHGDGDGTTSKIISRLIDEESPRLFKGWKWALPQLPESRRKSKILLGIVNISLMPTGVLCHGGYKSLINRNTLDITKDRDAPLVGKREFSTGLWGNHLENI